jgi:hypothetical protein
MNQQKHKKVRETRKKVKTQATGRGLTSQAGLLPVVNFLDSLNISDKASKLLSIAQGQNTRYFIGEILSLIIIATIGGATSIDGIINLWADPVLRKISGWIQIPYATTLARLFKKFDHPNASALSLLNHELRKAVWKRGKHSPKSMIIDLDSTVKTTFGKQEGAQKGYNTNRKGANSYHPLIAFCAETKEILMGWLRCGSTYTGNGSVEFMKELSASLAQEVKITLLRCDRGFFSGEFLSWLESKGYDYLIKVKIKNFNRVLSVQDWTPIKGHPGWEEAAFEYKCNGWKNLRRFVSVRKEIEKVTKDPKQLTFIKTKDYEYFSYVTSEDFSPWDTHKRYGERATCETWFDDAKNQMALGHIKTNSFWANDALFQCGIIAYNTLRWMALCSKDSTLKKWEPKTIRTFLIRIAGKLLTGSRGLKIIYPPEQLYQKQVDIWFSSFA